MASRGDLTLDTTTCEFQAGIAADRIALCLVPLAVASRSSVTLAWRIGAALTRPSRVGRGPTRKGCNSQGARRRPPKR